MTLLHKLKMVILVALLSVVFLSGCTTLPKPGPDTEPAIRQQADLVPEGTVLDVEVYDPIEGFNRGSYRFNHYFDKYFFLPIVKGYQFIMPDYAEDRVSSFVDNVYEFNNFTNNLLQLKFKETGITLSRFVINTTVGVAGLWDPSTHWGLHRQPEDFGQTLGHYGVGHGPFIVLPIFGPSNLRDTTGQASLPSTSANGFLSVTTVLALLSSTSRFVCSTPRSVNWRSPTKQAPSQYFGHQGLFPGGLFLIIFALIINQV
jgi:phospholipid-binding lipoprotein MlaA